jgi:hypothetical protein
VGGFLWWEIFLPHDTGCNLCDEADTPPATGNRRGVLEPAPTRRSA